MAARPHINWEDALCAARFSKLAYGDLKAVSKALSFSSLDAHGVDRGSTQVLCVDDPAARRAVVAFRGTERKLEDIKTDLAVRRVPLSLGGRVHQGFYDEIRSVWPEISEWAYNRRPSYIVFTGHSLGGALASLIHRLWRGGSKQPTACYTFGQPRVGDSDFVQAWEAEGDINLWRFVNNGDVVPRIPTFPYKHVGEELYFDCKGRLIGSPGVFKRAWDRFRGAIHDIGHWGLDGIKDHSMDEYLRLCESAARSQ